MTLFKNRKNRDEPKPSIAEPHAPMGIGQQTTEQPVSRALTAIERLKLIRSGKESELQKLAQDLAELDQVISWMDRFPEVEKIVAYLRNRL